METSIYPQKTREFHNHHFDSTIWNDFKFRDDDIIIATYAKAGTTWMQQIISQLIFNGQEGLPVAEMSPWLDLRVPPAHVKLQALEAQDHRRFIKTHLPTDALVFSPQSKYIYIARDGRDVVWSMYNHHAKANEKWYDALNNTPGRIGPPIEEPSESIRDYFLEWLENDGFPWWPFWENVASWWAIRNLPNVMFVHFTNLKQDMEGLMKKIASFLDIPIDEAQWDTIVKHCTFDYMKAHATASVPLGGIFWEGGAKTFINKGTNGRWTDILSEEESQKYESIAIEKLGLECSHWLKTGEMS
ncbi:MAG: sulfotransferase domain-containing protein [Saprospiraceae bacterium]|nr:sulfotransferase domain-containing protein [Saprospiraceae bacterium]